MLTERTPLDVLISRDQQATVSRGLDDLAHRVNVLPERAMRRAVILEALSLLTGEELVAMLAMLLQRVSAGQSQARTLLQEMALEPIVFSDLSYDNLKQAYALAQEAGLSQVAGMFLGAPVQTNPTIDEAFTENDHVGLPLGIRRSAARSADRFMLDRLVHDRNHRVIALLLNNPRLIERDVIKIAAARPTRPEVLSVVAQHPKWSSRYRVRKSLACNPYTPAPIARRLMPTLMQQDLMDVLSQGKMSPERQELARGLLAEKGLFAEE